MKKETVGFIVTLILGCLCLHGCTRKQYVKVPHKTFGYCLGWDYVESRAKNKPRCNAQCPYNNHYLCSRQRDHGGCHHAHGFSDCYWIWQKGEKAEVEK